MSNLLYLSLVTLSVLIIQVHTTSVLNQLTLSNDILSKIFFNHIQNKNVTGLKLEDAEKCVLALQEIVNRFPSMDVLPFVDAWGGVPSGLLYGHTQDLGNFDECLAIKSTNLSESIGPTNGKYCFASLPLKDQVLARRPYEDLFMISIGVCVPDVCDEQTLTDVFQEATANVLDGMLKEVYVHSCKTAESPSFEAVNIFGITIFSAFGLLMLLSTLYDIYTAKFDKQAKEIYLAFSVVTNGRKLFKISNVKSGNNINCLTGIRVLSMVWIIYCHCYSLCVILPIINKFYLLEWFKAATTLHIIMATVSVDTFFFMSGLLLAWLGFREMEKSNGKLNISMMYLHRYIRLTPPLAAVILYVVSIDKYIGSGPLRDLSRIFSGNCTHNWWSTLLYISNYTNPLQICVGQAWYLAVDTQLYFLSPLILIPLWKWGRKFVPVMFFLSFLSIGYVIATFFHQGFDTLMGVLDEDQLVLTYKPTHTRYSVWLVGIGLGYFMHKNRNNSIRLPKLIQILGWTVCFGIILAIIYGPYYPINADRDKTVLEAAMYESLRRVSWGIALSWIVFACHFGFGGFINSFLSHQLFQPISRLTFCMYLVHIAVQGVNYGTVKTDVYFSDYSLILVFWGTFGISAMASIVLTLAFEAPVLVIEKLLFKTKNHGIDQKSKTTPITPLETSHKLP